MIVARQLIAWTSASSVESLPSFSPYDGAILQGSSSEVDSPLPNLLAQNSRLTSCVIDEQFVARMRVINWRSSIDVWPCRRRPR